MKQVNVIIIHIIIAIIISIITIIINNCLTVCEQVDDWRNWQFSLSLNLLI